MLIVIVYFKRKYIKEMERFHTHLNMQTKIIINIQSIYKSMCSTTRCSVSKGSVHSQVLTQLLLLGSELIEVARLLGEEAASASGVPVQVTGSAKDTRLFFF